LTTGALRKRESSDIACECLAFAQGLVPLEEEIECHGTGRIGRLEGHNRIPGLRSLDDGESENKREKAHKGESDGR
jgi:hypothetical protein